MGIGAIRVGLSIGSLLITSSSSLMVAIPLMLLMVNVYAVPITQSKPSRLDIEGIRPQ
jgi:hypothetical protein